MLLWREKLSLEGGNEEEGIKWIESTSLVNETFFAATTEFLTFFSGPLLPLFSMSLVSLSKSVSSTTNGKFFLPVFHSPSSSFPLSIELRENISFILQPQDSKSLFPHLHDNLFISFSSF